MKSRIEQALASAPEALSKQLAPYRPSRRF